MNTIKDTETASTLLRGTSKVGELTDVTYSHILRVLGEPTFDVGHADEKVQVEWVVLYKGHVFSVYDWKTYDLDYTLNQLTTWCIGGKTVPTEFVDEFYERLNNINIYRYFLTQQQKTFIEEHLLSYSEAMGYETLTLTLNDIVDKGLYESGLSEYLNSTIEEYKEWCRRVKDKKRF